MYHIDYINHFVTEKSITIYWDKPKRVPKDTVYRVLLDGNVVEETSKTHCTIESLQANIEYYIQIEVECEGSVTSRKEYGAVRTVLQKKRKDVTQMPYNAVGDGITMNTKVLQKAIDDCGSDEVLYFPQGIFMTGALKLHSDMEIYLEEGAVLQGTDCVEDYLPRIASRFEGTELSCYSSVLNMGDLDHASGYNCRNILIHGKGTIASGGSTLSWRVIESERESLKD